MSGPDESDETRAAREAYEDAFAEGKGFADSELARLRAENERLRAAVEHVLRCIPMCGFAQIHWDSSTHDQLRAALKEE